MSNHIYVSKNNYTYNWEKMTVHDDDKPPMQWHLRWNKSQLEIKNVDLDTWTSFSNKIVSNMYQSYVAESILLGEDR